MKEQLAKRISEIEQAVKQKEGELIQLMGHLNEAKYMLETIFKSECEDICKTETPEVSHAA